MVRKQCRITYFCWVYVESAGKQDLQAKSQSTRERGLKQSKPTLSQSVAESVDVFRASLLMSTTMLHMVMPCSLIFSVNDESKWPSGMS